MYGYGPVRYGAFFLKHIGRLIVGEWIVVRAMMAESLGRSVAGRQVQYIFYIHIVIDIWDHVEIMSNILLSDSGQTKHYADLHRSSAM